MDKKPYILGRYNPGQAYDRPGFFIYPVDLGVENMYSNTRLGEYRPQQLCNPLIRELGSKENSNNHKEKEMPNIFLCVEWPLVIFLTIMAYIISKKIFKPKIAIAIAGMTGIVAIFVIANIVGVQWNMGRFEISDIFWNVLQFMFWPMIAV